MNKIIFSQKLFFAIALFVAATLNLRAQVETKHFEHNGELRLSNGFRLQQTNKETVVLPSFDIKSMNADAQTANIVAEPTEGGYDISVIINDANSQYDTSTNTRERKNGNYNWSIEAYSIFTGKLMFRNQVTGSTQFVDTSLWPEGDYVIRATIGEKFGTSKIHVGRKQ